MVVYGVDLIENLRVDDPIGTANGADTSTVVEGLFWGGGWDQLKAQFIGSATVTLITVAAGLALIYGVKATRTLRISSEGERQGIDIDSRAHPPLTPRWRTRCDFGLRKRLVAPVGDELGAVEA